jgi:hypothetical protein
VENVTPEEACIITSIFPTLSKLHRAYVDCWHGAKPRFLLPETIFSVLRIQRLREASFAHCIISESGLYAIAQCLGDVGSLLAKLTFRCCAMPAEQRTADLVVTGIKNNYVLEEFNLAPGPCTGDYHAFANPISGA